MGGVEWEFFHDRPTCVWVAWGDGMLSGTEGCHGEIEKCGPCGASSLIVYTGGRKVLVRGKWLNEARKRFGMIVESVEDITK